MVIPVPPKTLHIVFQVYSFLGIGKLYKMIGNRYFPTPGTAFSFFAYLVAQPAAHVSLLRTQLRERVEAFARSRPYRHVTWLN